MIRERTEWAAPAGSRQATVLPGRHAVQLELALELQALPVEINSHEGERLVAGDEPDCRVALFEAAVDLNAVPSAGVPT